MPEVTAIVLSAGRSLRMGDENKLFLPFQGATIIATVIDNLMKSDINDIIIVTSDFSKDKLLPYQNGRIQIVENTEYQKGMTTSIQKGVHSATNAAGYMICLGDQPFITPDTYNLLIKVFHKHYAQNSKKIIVPFYKKEKGNPVIFSSHYKKTILAHREPEGCKEIVQDNQRHIIRVQINTEEILKDIDTLEDYENISG
ncbi:nucleotidyltransferase family protein [Fulvivirga sp. M361]|uniref:nucleotidyltransferase family protein n=1 Tax=Fulvivirga sp. M361 TaxID=2594266 RepID=UPI00117A1A0A|nr:nucleotidyltransferase family protein [Fulvivirga sp. M361]TRX51596.1 nucleotidyltransferase family protein [Fulvivirga sp. M361]